MQTGKQIDLFVRSGTNRPSHFLSAGTFCSCTNSNTNTYWCVRAVNASHNYLYCEFVSGLITYYDMNIDPYQLRNIYQTLSGAELNDMHARLLELKAAGGEASADVAKTRPAAGSRHHKKRRRKGKHHHHGRNKQNSFNRRYGAFDYLL